MRAAASHAFPPLLPFCRVLAHARIRCPVRRRHAALTYAELEEVPDDARAFEQCGKMFLLRPVPELKESLAEAVESGNKDATALVEKTKHVEETYKKLQDDFNEFLKAHSALLPQPCRAAPLHAKPCVRSPGAAISYVSQRPGFALCVPAVVTGEKEKK